MKLSSIDYTFASLNFRLSVSEYMTTNVTVKSVSQRFCMKEITGVRWSLTCAAINLYYFKTVTFCWWTTVSGSMSERGNWQSFAVSRNLQNAKNHIKISESMIPHQTLFQHQHCYVQHLTWKLFTQNVTNVIFGFEISPNTNPKRKK